MPAAGCGAVCESETENARWRAITVGRESANKRVRKAQFRSPDRRSIRGSDGDGRRGGKVQAEDRSRRHGVNRHSGGDERGLRHGRRTVHRYHGKGRGARHPLDNKGNRMNKGKTEIPIADSESGVRRFRAPQPETPDIGESNPGGVWAIGRKTATYREEPLTMHKSIQRV